MSEFSKEISYIVLIIAISFSAYMFGYNRGVSEATVQTDLRQTKTLNALQVANQYQEKWMKCMESNR